MIKKILLFFPAAGALLLLLPAGADRFFNNGFSEAYFFLLPFLLAVFFTPFAARWGLKLKILDIPDARKIHLNPVPRTGGTVLFFAFLIAAGKIFYFPKEILGLLAGLIVVFLAEFLDDIKSNSAFLRLGAQAAAAVILITAGVYIRILPEFTGHIYIEYLLTVVWVTGIINAVNFLDGVDGLAAGLGIISGLSLFAIVYLAGQKELSLLLLAFTGALTGFIIFNFKPAKIFLGDSGASLIGFLLAGFSLIGIWGRPNSLPKQAIPLLVLAIPIFDMLYTTISRIKNGSVTTLKEWIEYTGRDHFHHRLMNIGIPDVATVLFLYGLNLIMGFLALALTCLQGKAALLPIILALLIFTAIVVYMRGKARKLAGK